VCCVCVYCVVCGVVLCFIFVLHHSYYLWGMVWALCGVVCVWFLVCVLWCVVWVLCGVVCVFVWRVMVSRWGGGWCIMPALCPYYMPVFAWCLMPILCPHYMPLLAILHPNLHPTPHSTHPTPLTPNHSPLNKISYTSTQSLAQLA